MASTDRDGCRSDRGRDAHAGGGQRAARSSEADTACGGDAAGLPEDAEGEDAGEHRESTETDEQIVTQMGDG